MELQASTTCGDGKPNDQRRVNRGGDMGEEMQEHN
jgi:hypothetical protein